MKVIVCCEKNNGMMFNNRRVSQDKVVSERIVELTKSNKLWMDYYSYALFEKLNVININLAENTLAEAADSEYCFIEKQELPPYEKWINEIVVFRWDRDYPFPRDKWIIVENTHEAIVSDELFNKTKSKECKSRKGVELGTTLFSGKVVCGCCGRNLYTWSKNHVLFCQTPTLSDDNPGCYDKKIHEDELIALVSDAIKFVTLNSKEKIARFRNDVTATTNELGSVKREIQNEVGKLDRLKIKKEKLFQKLMDGQMSDDEYMKLSAEVER